MMTFMILLLLFFVLLLKAFHARLQLFFINRKIGSKPPFHREL